MKDEIIHNLNAEFHRKVAKLNTKVEELETFRRETIKSEKKALKKHRQKAEKEVVENAFEPAAESFKDTNANLVNNSAESKPSLSNSSPVRQCSPVSKRPPCTPPSPHTPPGSPPQAAATLSGYFVASTQNAFQSEFQDSVEQMKEPVITTDYIKNISRINLVPRQARH